MTTTNTTQLLLALIAAAQRIHTTSIRNAWIGVNSCKCCGVDSSSVEENQQGLCYMCIKAKYSQQMYGEAEYCPSVIDGL
jgi:hypothetical protein